MRVLLVLLLAAAWAAAGEPVFGDWLVIEPVDRRTRHPFNPGALLARYIVPRDAAPPREGEAVRGTRGEKKWTRAKPNEKGFVAGRMAMAYATVRSDEDSVLLARVPGGSVFYLNGDAFVGDVYSGGHAGVPVQLRRGVNHLYVRGVRGRFRFAFDDPALAGESRLLFADRDLTAPHAVKGRRDRLLLSVPIMNLSDRWSGPLRAGGRAYPAGLVPLGVRRVQGRARGKKRTDGDVFDIEVACGAARTAVKVKVKEASDVRRVTFRSRIDGTVQQYSVLAPRKRAGAGMVLTLHGAGVDAFNQVRSYHRKDDLWIVAPTNRRPFGFDWQDWGRTDAYEVLEHAVAWTGADRSRLYLTGHSMGGHGTWHLGANDPDGFAAIAPSAGWCSFASYVGGGAQPSKRAALWHAADLSSDTLALVTNLVQLPTFILHGAADDNVPASEGRRMEKALRDAGAAPEVHFEPDKKHWWNGPRSKGVDCVDFPGIFDLFRRTKRNRDPDQLDFATADPSIDAHHHWVSILQPNEYGQVARVQARRRVGRVEIETRNVRRFGVGLEGDARRFVIDGQVVHAASDAEFFLTRLGWTVGERSVTEKHPGRSGPFKRAFGRGFVFVIGKDDTESLARARHDAQAWWYRANGDVPIVTDATYLADADAFENRNVILFGNADTNGAFARLLPDACPLRVRRGSITLGNRTWKGTDLGCVFVYPMRGDDAGLVGVFGHTGATGARAGYGLLPFVSGVGYPDYAIFGADFLQKSDGGVRAAGWFDWNWALPKKRPEEE